MDPRNPTDEQLTAMALEGAFRDVFGPLVPADDTPTLPDLIAAFEAAPDIYSNHSRLAWAIGQRGGDAIISGGNVYATDSSGHLVVRPLVRGMGRPDEDEPEGPCAARGDHGGSGVIDRTSRMDGRVQEPRGRFGEVS